MCTVHVGAWAFPVPQAGLTGVTLAHNLPSPLDT